MKYVHDQLYLGGEWRAPAGGGATTVVSPIDETPIGQVALAAPSDVDVAVTAAREALSSPAWAGLTPRAARRSPRTVRRRTREDLR